MPISPPTASCILFHLVRTTLAYRVLLRDYSTSGTFFDALCTFKPSPSSLLETSMTLVLLLLYFITVIYFYICLRSLTGEIYNNKDQKTTPWYFSIELQGPVLSQELNKRTWCGLVCSEGVEKKPSFH